jgi:hypothetical protein
MEVDLDGMKTYVDFEVFKILYDKDPYPTLLGIDWDFNNGVIVKFKHRKMLFEKEGHIIIQ